jgi:hypothetical protein
VIARKYTPYVFSFFMSLLMSGIMSFVITLLNLGPVDGLAGIWLHAWGMAFIVAFPTIVLVTPLVRALVTAVVDKEA